MLWLVSELSHKLFIPTSKEAPGRPRSALEGAHCHSPSKSLPGVTSSRKPHSSPDDMAGLLGLLWGVGFYALIPVSALEGKTESVPGKPGWERGDIWWGRGPGKRLTKARRVSLHGASEGH